MTSQISNQRESRHRREYDTMVSIVMSLGGIDKKKTKNSCSLSMKILSEPPHLPVQRPV